MNKKSNSGSGIFLMEMMMVVFFFLLCASTCILIFVKSDNMSKLAQDINQGVLHAESIAEVFHADRLDTYVKELQGTQLQEDKYRIHWDTVWLPVSSVSDTAYEAEILLSTERLDTGAMESAHIAIKRARDGKELYQLDTSRYLKP